MSNVSVDETQIAAFAQHLRGSGIAKPFDFCSLSEGFIYPGHDQPGLLGTLSGAVFHAASSGSACFA